MNLKKITKQDILESINKPIDLNEIDYQVKAKDLAKIKQKIGSQLTDKDKVTIIDDNSNTTSSPTNISNLTEEKKEKTKIDIDNIIDLISKTNENNPLYNHKYYPELLTDEKFVNNLIKKQFDYYKKNLERYDEFEPYVNDINVLKQKSFEYLKKILSLEKKHKNKLELLTKEICLGQLDINEDSINLNLSLTTKPTFEVSSSSEKIMVNNTNELELIKKEKEKRFIVNALIEGFVKSYGFLYNMKEKDILDIEPKLLEYYNKLISLNDYLHYVIILDELDDKINNETKSNQKNIKTGLFNIGLDNPNFNKITIDVNSIIFPTLIEETIKALLTYGSLNTLPKDNKIRKYIYNNVDLKDNDFYNYLIGVPLWETIEDNLDIDDFKYKPYFLFMLISKEPTEFEKDIKEIMLQTKDGIQLIKDMFKEIKNNVGLDIIDKEINEKNRDLSGDSNKEYLDFTDIENLKL